MDWIKKHKDSVAVITSIALSVWWMTSQVHQVEKDLGKEISGLRSEITSIQKDMAVIKAVLIIKGMMPVEIAAKGEK